MVKLIMVKVNSSGRRPMIDKKGAKTRRAAEDGGCDMCGTIGMRNRLTTKARRRKGMVDEWMALRLRAFVVNSHRLSFIFLSAIFLSRNGVRDAESGAWRDANHQ